MAKVFPKTPVAAHAAGTEVFGPAFRPAAAASGSRSTTKQLETRRAMKKRLGSAAAAAGPARLSRGVIPARAFWAPARA